MEQIRVCLRLSYLENRHQELDFNQKDHFYKIFTKITLDHNISSLPSELFQSLLDEQGLTDTLRHEEHHTLAPGVVIPN